MYGKLGQSDLHPSAIRMALKFIWMNLAKLKHLNKKNAAVPHSNEINGIHMGHSNDREFHSNAR